MGQGVHRKGFSLSVFKKKKGGGLSFIYFCLSRAEGSGEGKLSIYCSLYLGKNVGGGSANIFLDGSDAKCFMFQTML